MLWGEAPYGLVSRPAARPYLLMPESADGPMPARLSQTGAFLDTTNLVPSPALIPYDLVVPFWSDGAGKSRWIAVPTLGPAGPQRIKAGPTGEWVFPKGTVLVKHFELPTDARHPEVRRRLETRLLVCDSTGGVYGVTYKWRPDNSDADLLTTNLSEQILVQTLGGCRTQTWYYPNRSDCRTCHTQLAGGPLGPKTRQLNRPFSYPSGVTDNELRAWSHAGLLDPGFSDEQLASLPALTPLENGPGSAPASATELQARARSYLDANCAQCHRPGGTVANFDARFDTPLERQQLINGEVLIDEGLDNPRVIAPRDIWRSVAFLRVTSLDGLKMPPLAHQELDQHGIALMKEWIESLPGRPVLPPPLISPRGGHHSKSVEITVSETEPDCAIHYTLDGSVPALSDPLYDKPVRVNETSVFRAKAFKKGFTHSITVQEVFTFD